LEQKWLQDFLLEPLVSKKRNTILKAGKRVLSFAGDECKPSKPANKVAVSADEDGEAENHRDSDDDDTGLDNCGRIVDQQQGGTSLNFLIGRPATGPLALLTTAEVAALLRLSVSILNKWRLAGRGPQFVKVGTRVRYRLHDVAIFIAASTRGSTSATGPPMST
jgi:hypothetical protein